MRTPAAPASPTGDSARDGELIVAAERLATELLTAAIAGRGWRERMQGRRIARLLADDDGRAFVLALTDEVLRIRDPERASVYFERLIATSATPRFLGPVDRTLLGVGTRLATRYPRLIMPLVTARVRAELSTFVVPAESRPLTRHLRRRRADGIRVNLNLLGEEILGEQEAEKRIDAVLALMRRRDVDYISVKVSSVCSQLNMAAFESEVVRVSGRLRRLYDAALVTTPHTFVNLDMEEYRDLALTVRVFREVLSEPRYAKLDAGIVLQAYIPDSGGVLDELIAFARDRHARHGSAVKIRLVKGANLAGEQVQAELAGWPQAPYRTKADVDANYKRMLDRVLDSANLGALRVGVASHNLFEIAWALTLAGDRGALPMLEMEMLEGMAPSAAQAVRARAGNLLLYTPVARREDAESTIAYLIRRFDENAAPENFMHHQFALAPGTPEWSSERDRFRAAVADRHAATVATRRTQNRLAGPPPAPPQFDNEPETDLATAPNREWLGHALGPEAEHDGSTRTADGIPLIPVAVGDGLLFAAHPPGDTTRPGVASQPVGAAPRPSDAAHPPGDTTRPGVAARADDDLDLADGVDPGNPSATAYRWTQASAALVDRAVAISRDAGARWRAWPAADRAAIIRRAGDELAADRARLLATMAADAGKTVVEGDAEICEAIDFARYYSDLVPDDVRFTPFGTVAVVPPWNFPLAIPAGGVLAALAAGNAVIIKPAPETVATAWAMAQSLWRAGIPRDVFQFVPTADGPAGQRLVTHPDVDAVILTGAWETARMFFGWRPDLRLHAETSGKNAIVVTRAADLEAAVKDIVRSAFGHAGQKCSAASLAILEASVYDDERFLRQLADAAASLRVGPSTDPRSTVGPLIREPEGALAHALHELDEGERWLLTPSVSPDNPRQWTPGIKLGVRPGSAFHRTECFGPVLGLMRAPGLSRAVQWQNVPAYGLTAGLQSLDPDEIEYWREHVQAGNLYVNRHITGAIVRRQPFGGWKRSVVGPGAKAGGPNYVASLGTWRDQLPPDPRPFAAAAIDSWRRDFGPSDPSGLAGEANVLRYRPLGRVLLRAGLRAGENDVAIALAAARATRTEVEVSSAGELDIPGLARLTVEDDATLAARLPRTETDKLRLIGGASDALRLAGHDAGLWVDDVEVVGDPRIELLRWCREQALSETRHRHGNVTGRFPGPATRA